MSTFGQTAARAGNHKENTWWYVDGAVRVEDQTSNATRYQTWTQQCRAAFSFPRCKCFPCSYIFGKSKNLWPEVKPFWVGGPCSLSPVNHSVCRQPCFDCENAENAFLLENCPITHILNILTTPAPLVKVLYLYGTTGVNKPYAEDFKGRTGI